MSKELERYKEALDVAVRALDKVAETDTTTEGLQVARMTRNLVESIINPAPATETVEVVRLECMGCGAVRKGPSTGPQDYCCKGEDDIVLTGAFQRPVKSPVVREIAKHGVGITDKGEVYGNATFWKHPECHGKTVTLIARWEE